MKTTKAEITATVQCPECGDRIDITGYGYMHTDTFNFNRLDHIEIRCPECLKQFKIEGIK